MQTISKTSSLFCSTPFCFQPKNQTYVRRLPSESNKPFCFRPRVHGVGGSLSVWDAITAKVVGPLVFYDSRLNQWSAVSPDFNVIENLWGIIEKGLTYYRLTNISDLQQAIVKIWEGISVRLCENLVRSMPQPMKQSIRLRGHTSSKY
ncbi:unnamed protein product [Adineta ricciae]|uniref:Uncharacterized protein n=1 Tax=Adineta ricciae TaxID=249248 RepID=A0A816HDA2_ADIRI|nr:unnamed protein product [Adineta ricciae]CAF1684520.1 unnamed protein product [Adineta ricciae]